MPDKLMRLWRHDQAAARRPVMLAIAGDSAAGKTTLTRGIAETLGADRATALCVDDYHRYDRAQRRDVPFTVLHPDCNYIEVMEQHLQLLALGRPVLKPVYDHSTGELVRPVLVEPAGGQHPVHSEPAEVTGPRVLRQVADRAGAAHGAADRQRLPRQHPRQRGLARAVPPHQADLVARGNLEARRLEQQLRARAQFEAACHNHENPLPAPIRYLVPGSPASRGAASRQQ